MDRSAFDWLNRALLLLGLAFVVSSCDDDLSRPDPDPDPEPEPEFPAVVAVGVIDSTGPIFRSLDVDLDSAARVEVFYTPTTGGRVFHVRSDLHQPRHEVALHRLRPNTEYQVAVRTYRPNTTSDSIFRLTVATDSLPVPLRALNYTVTGEAGFPLLMVPIRGNTLGGWQGQVAVESDGTVVWYYQSAGGTLVAKPVPGTHDMIFIEGGFPSDAGRNGIVRVTPDGRIAALLDRSTAGVAFGQIHHDATAVDDQRVYFLAYDTMTVRDTIVNGEAVWEWNMVTGAVVKRWSSWDFFDWDTDRGPGVTPQGWLHANSIMVGPRGNVVVSSRSLNQVFSISSDFDSIEYRVGGPNATIAVAPDDRFVGQHSAWELPGGRLLLFDNRGAGPDSIQDSRSLELQMNGDSAWRVWQYDPVPDVFSPLRGGVYRLDNGNSVTVFASLPFQVHETTPDGTVVWTLNADSRSFSDTFRVAPWPSIAGEIEVDAMP